MKGTIAPKNLQIAVIESATPTIGHIIDYLRVDVAVAGKNCLI